MAKEFRLNEHNFQNVPGDHLNTMDVMSADGWEIENTTIGFPYVHVLWSREVKAESKPASRAATVKASATDS